VVIIREARSFLLVSANTRAGEPPTTPVNSVSQSTLPAVSHTPSMSTVDLDKPSFNQANHQALPRKDSPLSAADEGLMMTTQTKPASSSAHLQPPQPESSTRATGPKPWNFPILRLTPGPAASPKHKNNIYDSQDAPFVFNPTSPFRLPGPTRLAGVFTDYLDL